MEVQEKPVFMPPKKRTSGKRFTASTHADHIMTVQVRFVYCTFSVLYVLFNSYQKLLPVMWHNINAVIELESTDKVTT